MEAYDLLKQLSFLSHGGYKDEIFRGSDLASKAIVLDPNYADAYAVAGQYKLYSGVFAGFVEMKTAIRNAIDDINKALELDPNNQLAHILMGNIYEWGKWDYIEAEKEYLKLKQLAPNIANARFIVLVGEFFLKMIRVEDAIPYFKQTSESEYPGVGSMYIKSLILSGRKQEAYDYIDKNLNLLKKSSIWLGESYIWLQEFDSAFYYYDRAMKSGESWMETPRIQAAMALASYKTKKTENARKIISQLEKNTSKTQVGSLDYFIGWYYSGIGEVDSAFVWLEKAIKNQNSEFSWLKADPVFGNIKSDKRYPDLYRRTGHKAYDDYMNSMKR